MAGEGEEKVLQRMAVAFEPLAELVKSGGAAMEVGPFAHACAQVSFLKYLGIAFKFASKDYASKVGDLIDASKSIKTLNDMIDLDIQHDCVKQLRSHTRNLLKVKRGLDVVRVLFEEIMNLEGNSIRNAASVAYDKVFARHLGQDIRKAVDAAMHAVPPKPQLFEMLNEDDYSAKVAMQRFIRASGPVIQYIEELFDSRHLGIDW